MQTIPLILLVWLTPNFLFVRWRCLVHWDTSDIESVGSTATRLFSSRDTQRPRINAPARPPRGTKGPI